MAYITNYIIEFDNIDGVTCEVLIEDTDSGTGTATFTDLQPSEQPFVWRVIDNETDPFAPIKAKELVIEFLSTETEGLQTFAYGTDTRFKVTAKVGGTIVFVGFLLMDDISQDYQPPETGVVVTLTATDNLGTLKDLELTANGTTIVDGHYSVLTMLLWCFNVTGLQLNLNIVYNVVEYSQVAGSAFAHAQLHSLTWEKDIGTKINCYEVLQDILESFHCRAFQEEGEWWVVRVHEHRRTSAYDEVYKHDSAGNFLGSYPVIQTKTIGPANDAWLINEDAQLTLQRPDKYNVDEYRYEFPREIVPNIDFTRGTFISGTNPKLYTVGNWTTGKFGGAAALTPYIRKAYDAYGSETERWVVIPVGSGAAHYIISEAIPLHAKDKFTFLIEWKLASNITGSSGTTTSFIAQLRLYGDDGTYWTLHDGLGGFGTQVAWVQSNSTFTTNTRFVKDQWDITTWDETQWRNLTVESVPLPVSGDLYILLIEHTVTGNKETHFNNVRFDYIPYINGGYGRYIGQHNKVTATSAYKAKKENRIAISNSPKKLFKGALKKLVSGAYVLVDTWTDYTFGGLGSNQPLGRIMVYDYWNQYYIERTILTGTVQTGNDSLLDYSKLYCNYAFAGSNALTGTRLFILLAIEVDVNLCEIKATYMEVRRTNLTPDYATPHEFKYIQ